MTETIRPKKALGQHFLHDPSYCRRIVELAGVGPEDTVLEIGPGTGHLTEHLLRSARRVIAVEVDRDLVLYLKKRWPSSHESHLTVLSGNILTLNLSEIEMPGRLSLVSNLPYHISTRILRRMTEYKDRFQSLTVMVQKEVAHRILAIPGGEDFGYFSVLMDFHFDRQDGFVVPPGAFRPPPKVDSQVVRLIPRNPIIEIPNFPEFDKMLQVAFRHPRKTIWNNLKREFDARKLGKALEHASIAPTLRPAQISTERYGCLFLML